MTLIDISPALRPTTAVWPGDVALSRSVAMSFAQGHHLDLSSVQTTVHIGAHADAPSHYRPDGAPIDARPLDRYYGPCQVVRVDVARGERVLPRHLPGPVTAPRVLFATGTFPDPDAFTTDFAALSPELLDALAAQGVVLVGLDTPSVDPFDSKALESHQALARHDMAVLEGLVLSHVEPGRYTLIALPLRLEGADASPVRAALAPLP
jgi:arylformamidase